MLEKLVNYFEGVLIQKGKKVLGNGKRFGEYQFYFFLHFFRS